MRGKTVINQWLDLPFAGVFAALIAFYGVTALAIVWACFGTPLGDRLRRFDGVVGPFFGSVGILFALLTGFLASDIADRNRQAARAVQVEAGELRNIYALSVASASDMHDIRAAWRAYVHAAIQDEWPAMARGEQAAAVNAAYDTLLREVSEPKIAVEAGAAVHGALLSATVRMGTARSDRLALAADRTSSLKWEIVLLLGVMTQAAIGLVHLTKRNPHVAALTVFSVAVVIALGLIAMQERPFAGEVRIPPTALQDVLKMQNGS